jgi:hypothetical protein
VAEKVTLEIGIMVKGKVRQQKFIEVAMLMKVNSLTTKDMAKVH